jgi:YD repeat-containing protein
LLDWRPGTAEVLLSDFSAGGVHLVDLATGSTQLIATTMAFWNDPQFVPDGSGDVLRYDWDGARRTMARVDSDGSVIARTPEFAVADVPIVWHTSPDGTLLAVNDARGPALYSTDTLTPVASTSPYPARPDACRVWTWTSDDELLLPCSTAGATTLDPWEMRAEYWLVPTDGGAPTLMSGMPEAMRLGGAWRVDGRLVVSLSGVSEARASWWEWTEQGLTPLSSGDRNVVDVLGVEGSTIVFSEFSYQSGPQEPYQRVVALDPFTGERHILISTPPATLGAFGIAPQGQREASASQGGD